MIFVISVTVKHQKCSLTALAGRVEVERVGGGGEGGQRIVDGGDTSS